MFNRYLLLVLFFPLLLCGKSFSKDSEEKKKPEYVVRKVNWGMTIEQVKKSEEWKFLREGDGELGEKMHVEYKGSLLNVDCYLTYVFSSENKLITVGYAFFEDKEELLKHTLTAKYGEPKRDFGQHIWFTKDGKTSITLGEDGGITIVMYSDKIYFDKKNAEKALRMLKEADKAF